jgi:signal transduction histidine kinase/CheY-like chemotaxis protein
VALLNNNNLPKYVHLTGIATESGERCLVTLVDITERKKVETDLLEAREKAEENDRLKTAFLQNMSHEIRSPLNAIMGFSELLVENYNNKPKLEQFSGIIRQRCNDLLDIITDLLDIAKIDSGQLSIHMEEFDLQVLFAEIMSFFTEQQKRLGKQNINFSLQTFCEPSEAGIITDKGKLKQIFINLIGNAFKFTDIGTIEGGCKFDANHHLIFYVSDTGIGIPTDKQKVVFERFMQLKQGTNHVGGGTGLGLSIVKGLVSLLGGEIWLESEPGKGSTFTFTFPYKTIQSLRHEPLMVEKTEGYCFSNKTILIVEDDLHNTEYLKEILVDKGLNIMYTVYGKDAVQISLAQPLDLALMDIRLPDMDGYEAIRQIKQHKPHLKIIAQTAYASLDERQKAINAGCDDYISKPIQRNMLLSMINKLLS